MKRLGMGKVIPGSPPPWISIAAGTRGALGDRFLPIEGFQGDGKMFPPRAELALVGPCVPRGVWFTTSKHTTTILQIHELNTRVLALE